MLLFSYRIKVFLLFFHFVDFSSLLLIWRTLNSMRFDLHKPIMRCCDGDTKRFPLSFFSHSFLVCFVLHCNLSSEQCFPSVKLIAQSSENKRLCQAISLNEGIRLWSNERMSHHRIEHTFIYSHASISSCSIVCSTAAFSSPPPESNQGKLNKIGSLTTASIFHHKSTL